MQIAANGHSVEHAPRVHFVGIHSFRGGSGKTTLAANLAFLAARAGARVAILDADLQAPALHCVLGVETKRILHSVSEFVKEKCEIEEVPIDLSRELGLEEPGTLHFLPANPDLQMTSSILFEGYDVARLNEHLRRLAGQLELDLLFLDTHLGINRETLLSLATADTVMVLLRPDGQDHEGASVLVEIAKKVGVPSTLLVPNMIAESSDAARADEKDEKIEKLEKELGAPVACVLPWCPELSELGCDALFAARHQDHPFTARLERVLQRLMPVESSSGAGS